MNAIKILTRYFFVACSFIVYGQNNQNVFISEFHYDNVGTDVQEGVELTASSGTDLSCYKLYFYNGNDSSVYNSLMLSGIVQNESCGFGANWFDVEGIQNGSSTSCDAIGLYNICDSSIIQFISYEGQMLALDGPFQGVSSQNI